MTHFVYEPPEFAEIEDGQWIIPDTNISIQDCKHYCGFYAINADLGDAVQEIGIAKTLAEAKKVALQAAFQ
jgi:hypothetical protein